MFCSLYSTQGEALTMIKIIQIIMKYLAQQEEVHKATNDLIAALAAAITLQPIMSATSRQIADLQLSMQQINFKIHYITSSAQYIEHIHTMTLKTPF